VLGTRFSVRYAAANPQAGVQVAVEEGRVQVLRVTPAGEAATPDGAGDPMRRIVLTAGQAVASDAQGQLGAVSAVAAAGIAPWREGRVAFDNTPLSQALAEFERYGDTALRISDPVVGRLRLSGSFDVRKADNFARALPRALPVSLHDNGAMTEIVLER